MAKRRDIQVLQASKLQRFAASCNEQFKEKPVLIEHMSEVQRRSQWSYAFNAISAVFAIFGLYVLSGQAQSTKASLLLILLGALLIGNEFFKRSQILRTAKLHFDGFNVGFAAFILFLPTLLSVGTSAYGGFKLAPELRGTPALVHNPQIDSLKTELGILNASIKKQEGTTWKGRVTRDANKNLKQLYSDRSALNTRIEALAQKDEKINTATLSGFGQETQLLGWLMAFIGILMDALLYFNLWKVMQCKHEVATLFQDIHSPDDFFDENKWLQPVATDEKPEKELESEQAYIRRLQSTPEDMLKHALADAKSNLKAWSNKIKKGIGKAETNKRGQAKYQRKVELIEQELQSRTPQMAS